MFAIQKWKVKVSIKNYRMNQKVSKVDEYQDIKKNKYVKKKE